MCTSGWNQIEIRVVSGTPSAAAAENGASRGEVPTAPAPGEVALSLFVGDDGPYVARARRDVICPESLDDSKRLDHGEDLWEHLFERATCGTGTAADALIRRVEALYGDPRPQSVPPAPARRNNVRLRLMLGDEIPRRIRWECLHPRPTSRHPWLQWAGGVLVTEPDFSIVRDQHPEGDGVPPRLTLFKPEIRCSITACKWQDGPLPGPEDRNLLELVKNVKLEFDGFPRWDRQRQLDTTSALSEVDVWVHCSHATGGGDGHMYVWQDGVVKQLSLADVQGALKRAECPPRLLVAAGCNTASLFRDVAAWVPAIVAFDGAPKIEALRVGIPELLEHLARGEPLDSAVAAMRCAIQRRLQDPAQVSMPVLYCRSGQDRLVGLVQDDAVYSYLTGARWAREGWEEVAYIPIAMHELPGRLMDHRDPVRSETLGHIEALHQLFLPEVFVGAERRRFAAVLGKGGTGKSTLTRHIMARGAPAAVQMIASGGEVGSWGDQGPAVLPPDGTCEVPIRLDLKQHMLRHVWVGAGQAPKPEAAGLREALNALKSGLGDRFFDPRCEQHWILLADGLDELPDENGVRDSALQELRRVVESNRRVRCVVTCRTDAFVRERSDLVWEMKDLDDQQLLRFIRAYAGHPGYSFDADRLIAEVDEEGRERLREYMRFPRPAWLVCRKYDEAELLKPGGGGDVLDLSLGQIYDEDLEDRLSGRQEQEHRNKSGSLRLSPGLKRRLLQRLALEWLMDGEVTISREGLRRWIADLLMETGPSGRSPALRRVKQEGWDREWGVGRFRWGTSESELDLLAGWDRGRLVEQFAEELTTFSGILAGQGKGDRVGFLDKQWQGYLAARCVQAEGHDATRVAEQVAYSPFSDKRAENDDVLWFLAEEATGHGLVDALWKAHKPTAQELWGVFPAEARRPSRLNRVLRLCEALGVELADLNWRWSRGLVPQRPGEGLEGLLVEHALLPEPAQDSGLLLEDGNIVFLVGLFLEAVLDTRHSWSFAGAEPEWFERGRRWISGLGGASQRAKEAAEKRWQELFGKADALWDLIGDPPMVTIPCGEKTYRLGAEPTGKPELDGLIGQIKDNPSHQVTLSGFELQQHPMGAEALQLLHPWRGRHSSQPEDELDHPAVCVTWYEAYGVARRLGCRLPTEAEWELAARGWDEAARDAGRSLPAYPWGDQPPPDQDHAHSSTIGTARYHQDGRYAREAGTARWGDTEWAWLFDMCGNTWDWCFDRYGKAVEAMGGPNPRGAETGSCRVLRGGGWNVDAAAWLLAAFRLELDPSFGLGAYGFRLARTRHPAT